MWGVSFWIFPVISGLTWLGTLLGLLLNWIIHDHSRRLPSFNDGQTIAYISDTGAFRLKPLFIAGSAVTMVFLDLAFLSERWLRHSRRLVPNTVLSEKILSGFAILFAIIGSVGLICLSILDTYRHNKYHNAFLVVFIAGWVINAILICAEYQRLGIHHRDHRVLRISFWFKLFFILVEIPLAIAFGALGDKSRYNPAAVVEWVIALIFTFYIFSFFIDLIPAVRTKHNRYSDQETRLEQEAAASEQENAETRQQEGARPTSLPLSEKEHEGTAQNGPKAPVASNF